MNNIKKGLLGFVLVATLVVVGPVSQLSAVTHEENLAQTNVLKSRAQSLQPAKPQPSKQFLSPNSLDADNFSYTWKTDLRLGMRNNNDVRALQQALTIKGFYKGKIDGNFYKSTRQAVIKFQKKYGLKKNGVVGKATRKKLNDLYGSDGDKSSSDNKRIVIPTPTTTTILSPTIKIIYPNSDGEVPIGSSQYVYWHWTGNKKTSVRISLANTRTETETGIITEKEILGSSRSHKFLVPNIPVGKYVVKVCVSSSSIAPFVCGESAPFTIVASKTTTTNDLPTITVTLPHDGEVQIGSSQSVDWQWTGNETKFKIFLSSTSTNTDVEIGTGISSNSRPYKFLVPKVPAGKYRIRVCDSYHADASFVCDISDTFSIVAAKTSSDSP